jgi:hypothetical protein
VRSWVKKLLVISLVLASVGGGFVVGRSRSRVVERVVEKKLVRPDPEFALDVVRCLQKSTESLRNCSDCPCYPARWAARMSEMQLRNCVGDQDDVLLHEMQKWSDGEYGWTRQHVVKSSDRTSVERP